MSMSHLDCHQTRNGTILLITVISMARLIRTESTLLTNNSTVLGSHVLSHLILTTLCGGYNYSHLTDKKAEVQTG